MSRRIGRVDFMAVAMQVARWSPEDKADLMTLLAEERTQSEKDRSTKPRRVVKNYPVKEPTEA